MTWERVVGEVGAALPGLPPTWVGPGDEGEVLLCWSHADYYAEVRVSGDGYEWFARDRTTDACDGSTEPELALSPRFVAFMAWRA